MLGVSVHTLNMSIGSNNLISPTLVIVQFKRQGAQSLSARYVFTIIETACYLLRWHDAFLQRMRWSKEIDGIYHCRVE